MKYTILVKFPNGVEVDFFETLEQVKNVLVQCGLEYQEKVQNYVLEFGHELQVIPVIPVN